MLTEGAIRVPFIVYWGGKLPGGRVYDHPVISLDVAATATALAGLPSDAKLDGVNLIPYLRGERKGAPADALYWRWVAQAAVREGKWKYLLGGDREHLFDLDADKEETRNLVAAHPEVAARLKAKLERWSKEFDPPGLATKGPGRQRSTSTSTSTRSRCPSLLGRSRVPTGNRPSLCTVPRLCQGVEAYANATPCSLWHGVARAAVGGTNMRKIKAKVNARLLAKAERLFTGTLDGRVIEILQNARRAGATEVVISNSDGVVTVRDNGSGIEDFAKLVDLGGSGWDAAFEQSEDPAGVGIFCLAGKNVTIRSRGMRTTIDGDGWLGKAITVVYDDEAVDGMELQFDDEPWTLSVVEPHAVFCGMEVKVDGRKCEKLSFVSKAAQHYPQLGCRIEARGHDQMEDWHDYWRRRHCPGNVLVNFHGQVVSCECRPMNEHSVGFLVELTGEPTSIRLMLPARTQLVENEAFKQLGAAMEVEGFRHFQRQGHHRLPYADFLRARELGVELPEATPEFDVGLLSGDTPEPVAVTMPKGFPLSRCYRLSPTIAADGLDPEANAHLLGALGKPERPFVPVWISDRYDGYSWAKLATIDRVDVELGKRIGALSVDQGGLECFDSVEVTCNTSDGQAYSSPVCMATLHGRGNTPRVALTPAARQRVYAPEVWFHLGGYEDGGDTYFAQSSRVSDALDDFWLLIDGPDEPFRSGLMRSLNSFAPGWRSFSVKADGVVKVVLADGSRKTITPPRRAASKAG